jgi:hypothetical protein
MAAVVLREKKKYPNRSDQNRNAIKPVHSLIPGFVSSRVAGCCWGKTVVAAVASDPLRPFGSAERWFRSRSKLIQNQFDRPPHRRPNRSLMSVAPSTTVSGASSDQGDYIVGSASFTACFRQSGTQLFAAVQLFSFIPKTRLLQQYFAWVVAQRIQLRSILK